MLRVVLKGNHKSWDEYLPHIEFAYNRVVHKATNISPFEVVYGFNPLTPIDLILLPNVNHFIHKEGASRADFVKKLHERIKTHIQLQNKKYTKANNKGKQNMIFEEGLGFGFTLEKNVFPNKGSQNLVPEEMDPFNSYTVSMIMLIGLIYPLIMVLALLLMLLI
uniref:Transposon Ty3-I Gag-Pol polyprotein n=1 Tax=Cajanus cajan TaxID=3821 RepID=A0A151RLD9_CAJCA|nr:hypothetical protein KK1_035198 [Cajanus cajan]